MNSLLLSMPGTPVIYYGDEIGMGDNIHLGDRMACARRCNGRPIAMAGFPVPTRRRWCCRRLWTRCTAIGA